MFVGRTVCERILVFGLVGVSVLVFCVSLCVCGRPVRLRMCLHVYFVFGCVSAYVCILSKIRVFRYCTCNMHTLINYIFLIFDHLLSNITHLGPIALV